MEAAGAGDMGAVRAQEEQQQQQTEMTMEKLKDALDVLLLAEEAFDVASHDIKSRVDNVPILLLDVVWVMFRLRDANKLAAAVSRLRACRDGFNKSHGPNLERLRTLQGGFTPEMGIYVRLELLEGVAAYHAGDGATARDKLTAAHDRWKSLQLSDDALASLAGMGFDGREASRGLRFCGGDVAAAAAFIIDQRSRAAASEAAARQRAASERERRRYGRTPRGALVDEDALKSMEEMGYCRQLAAAALRATENAVQASLDYLATPFGREALEEAAMAAAEDWDKEKRRRRSTGSGAAGPDAGGGGSRRSKKRSKTGGGGGGDGGGGGGVSATAEVTLVEMGFEAAAVRRALVQSGGDVDAAAALLVEGGGGGDAAGAAGNDGDANEQREGDKDDDGGDDDDSSGSDDDDNDGEEGEDEEMEAEIAGGVASGDALNEYDIDLALEGQAISEFLALVNVQPVSA